jgi:hypothetical protein
MKDDEQKALLDHLQTLWLQEKRLDGFGGWEEQNRNRPVLSFLEPVLIDWTVVQGLFLRGQTPLTTSDRNVTFVLEYHTTENGVLALSRVDWRPPGEHNNKGRGPTDLQFTRISGSHLHPFDLNAAEGLEFLSSAGNLPIACLACEDVESFGDLKIEVGSLLNFATLSEILPPPWEDELLL